MLRSFDFLVREHAGSLVILAVVLVLAGIAALVAVPVPGRDNRAAGVVTDVGPLNAGETSANQRATVLTTGGQSFIVEVADYPTCRVGSHVVVHRRRTLIGTKVGIWPEGCR